MNPSLFLVAIGVLTSCLNLLLATFLALAKGQNWKANRFLAGFLLLSAIDMIGWASALLPPSVQPWLMLRRSLAFMQMPWFFAYFLALLRPDRSSVAHRRLGWILVAASAASLAPRALAMLGFDFPFDMSNGGEMRWISIALHFQFYVYAAWIAHLVFAPDREQDQALPVATCRWLKALLITSVTAGTLVFAKSLFRLAGDAQAYGYLDLVVGSSASAIICALTLFALLHRDLLVGPATTVRAQRKIDPDSTQMADLAALQSFMTSREPFLDPDLSLRKLARQVALPERELSRLINELEGLHFFDFVNRYRIKKAARILADPGQAPQTILEIAHDVGFNSKSSFNSAFLKHIGQTPSSFRRSRAPDSPPSDQRQ